MNLPALVPSPFYVLENIYSKMLTKTETVYCDSHNYNKIRCLLNFIHRLKPGRVYYRLFFYYLLLLDQDHYKNGDSDPSLNLPI